MADLHPLNRVGNWLKQVKHAPKSIVILAVFIGFLFVQTPQASGASLIYDHSEIGFSSACSYYNIAEAKTQLDFNSKLNSLRLNKYTESIGQFKQKPGNLNWEWEINESYFVDIPIYKNKSYEDVCFDEFNISYSCTKWHTVVSGYKPELRWKTAWIKNEMYSIVENDALLWEHTKELGYTRVRFCADFTREKTERGWSIRLDHVPEFAGMSYPEYTWWDSDYGFRHEIYSNATEIIPININDTGFPNIWTLNASSADGEHKYLYCKASNCTGTDWAIANETLETYWENGTSRTGSSPTEVFKDAVGRWHFDEGSGDVCYDSSEYSIDADSRGGITRNDTVNVFGDAVIFDGTDDCVNLTGIPAFAPTTAKPITVMFWFYWDATDADAVILSLENSNFAVTIYSIIGSYITWGKSGDFDKFDWLNVSTGSWHFLVFNWSGATATSKVWVDGIDVGLSDSGEAYEEHEQCLGCRYCGAAADQRYFKGQIDELQIYNESIPFAEHIIYYYNGINNLTIFEAEEEVSNTTPKVNLYNITGSTLDSTPGIDFNYTDDDLNAACYLLLNNTAYNVNISTENATRTTLIVNESVLNDDYAIKVSCTDGINTGNSSTIILTVENLSMYNISFYDEITNLPINFSADKNGTSHTVCSAPAKEIRSNISGTLHNYVIDCTSINYIKFTLFDPKGDHYRILIPSTATGNLTYYMINTTPADVTINFVTFSVTDASGLYQAGIMHFKKTILTEGRKDIIDTTIGSDGKVYANLIGGETYTISVESADGTNSKTLGEYTVPDATTTSQPLTIIDITFIPTTYNFIGTDISWNMELNTSMSRIYFYYNDSNGQTNSIKFWIYNITNVTARTQMYYDTVSG